jgi:hypothetical protein
MWRPGWLLSTLVSANSVSPVGGIHAIAPLPPESAVSPKNTRVHPGTIPPSVTAGVLLSTGLEFLADPVTIGDGCANRVEFDNVNERIQHRGRERDAQHAGRSASNGGVGPSAIDNGTLCGVGGL